ncbi:MAG: SMI1/KNR4 family protein [Fimbriiglobus sp.]
MEEEFLNRLAVAFPEFAAKLGDGSEFHLEQVQPPVTDEDLSEIEEFVGVPLPESYKSLLGCGREFWLLGGVVQFGFEHPFTQDFSDQEKPHNVKDASWPPPAQGMVCVAEFCLEADGDQVLFDVSRGLVNGEYPVMYYSHESNPPTVRKLADSFPQFLSEFLDYPGLQ